MTLKTILIILAAGFAVSFLAVPACRMITGAPAIVPPTTPSVPAPSITESGSPD